MSLTMPRPKHPKVRGSVRKIRSPRQVQISDLAAFSLDRLTFSGASRLAEVRRSLRRQEEAQALRPRFLMTNSEIRMVVEQVLRDTTWRVPTKTKTRTKKTLT